MYDTPLRYPGGKRRLSCAVMALLEANGLSDIDYAEPFAGGAAVALRLLFEEYAANIHLNDLSPYVYALWDCILNRPEILCDRIRRVRVTMAEWNRQRKIFENHTDADPDILGFATLFLNRTNRSGIISGGVIGGKRQSGTWKLDVRFSKNELVDRICKISRYRSRIFLYKLDCKTFIDSVVPSLPKTSFLFFDPPYIERSRQLYLNNFKLDDHIDLSHKIANVELPWIVTYDEAALKYKLFPRFRRVVYGIEYTAQRKYRGTEVMYFSDGLLVPKLPEMLGHTAHIIRSRMKVSPIRK